VAGQRAQAHQRAYINDVVVADVFDLHFVAHPHVYPPPRPAHDLQDGGHADRGAFLDHGDVALAAVRRERRVACKEGPQIFA
jgi:hypothetical protein